MFSLDSSKMCVAIESVPPLSPLFWLGSVKLGWLHGNSRQKSIVLRHVVTLSDVFGSWKVTVEVVGV